MSNVKNVIALTQETVANSTTGDVNTDDNTLFVDKSANRVGIGTSNPQTPLDVTGQIRTSLDTTHYGTFNGLSGALYISHRNDTDDGAIIFGGQGGGTFTEKMRITPGGNIGIGTTAGLSNTLNVEGTGRFTGNVTASYFKGNGSQLTNLSAGATGGGSDQIFFLSDQNVTADYTIPTGRNALSAGPLTVNTGVTVTIPSGSAWTIV
jgi:hypothetical protein